MRAAPAVAVRCDGGRLWFALHTALPALAAAALVGWGALLGGVSSELAAAASLFAAAVGGLLARRTRPHAGLLQWDGQRWTADGQPGQLQLMIDPGFLLVLRLHLDGGGDRWLAVSAAEAGPAWPALRAAVHARPPRASLRLLAPERSGD